jgi:hypothetical protein
MYIFPRGKEYVHSEQDYRRIPVLHCRGYEQNNLQFHFLFENKCKEYKHIYYLTLLIQLLLPQCIAKFFA